MKELRHAVPERVTAPHAVGNRMVQKLQKNKVLAQAVPERVTAPLAVRNRMCQETEKKYEQRHKTQKPFVISSSFSSISLIEIDELLLEFFYCLGSFDTLKSIQIPFENKIKENVKIQHKNQQKPK